MKWYWWLAVALALVYYKRKHESANAKYMSTFGESQSPRTAIGVSTMKGDI